MKLKETKSRPKPPNYGKFQTKGIKVVGKWKKVKIDPNIFADGQMDDLVCFEELTDYQLVSPSKNSSSLFSKEEPKKRKAQTVSSCPIVLKFSIHQNHLESLLKNRFLASIPRVSNSVGLG